MSADHLVAVFGAPIDPRSYELIREDIRESLLAYSAEARVPLGGFLEAVISNDFTGAAARADSDNLRALAAIACFVYNELDSRCWGSYRIYRCWLEYRAAERAGHGERTANAMADLRDAHEEARKASRS